MRLIAILLLLVLPSSAAAQTVDEQIRTEVSRFVRVVNGGDASALAALYLNESHTSSVGDGQIVRGWQGITDLLREVYAQVGTIQMTVDSVSVLPLGLDAAVAVMRYRWVLGRANPQPMSGALTLVYTRAPQGWRVAHDHSSTLTTNAAVAAPATPVTDSGPSEPVRPTSPCTVTRIVDGDTIECTQSGRIRLIGIDTPELSQPPFGSQAASALAALIPPGSSVNLEGDVEARDRYGRVLAYVWVDQTLVNWRMVREGWAVLLTYPPNVQYVDHFGHAERMARDEGRGLWATGGFGCRPVDRRRGRCD